MAITPDPLTTLASVKLVLGIPTADTSQDAVLSLYVGAASSAITNSCNRTHFLSSNAANPITEYYSGNGSEWLYLHQYPVQGVTSIYLDDYGFWGATTGGFPTSTLLVGGTDYALVNDNPDGTGGSGMVLRLNGIWDNRYARAPGYLSVFPVSGRGNVKVTYTVGYTSLPSDLSWAAAQVVARMYNTGPTGQEIGSESYEEYSRSLIPVANAALGVLAGTVNPVLARYRIVPLGLGG